MFDWPKNCFLFLFLFELGLRQALGVVFLKWYTVVPYGNLWAQPPRGGPQERSRACARRPRLGPAPRGGRAWAAAQLFTPLQRAAEGSGPQRAEGRRGLRERAAEARGRRPSKAGRSGKGPPLGSLWERSVLARGRSGKGPRPVVPCGRAHLGHSALSSSGRPPTISAVCPSECRACLDHLGGMPQRQLGQLGLSLGSGGVEMEMAPAFTGERGGANGAGSGFHWVGISSKLFLSFRLHYFQICPIFSAAFFHASASALFPNFFYLCVCNISKSGVIFPNLGPDFQIRPTNSKSGVRFPNPGADFQIWRPISKSGIRFPNLGPDFQIWQPISKSGVRFPNPVTNFQIWRPIFKFGVRFPNPGSDFQIWRPSSKLGVRFPNPGSDFQIWIAHPDSKSGVRFPNPGPDFQIW